MRARLYLILVLLLGAGSGLTAAGEPALEISVPAGQLAVGDRLAVRVMARGDADLMWGELSVQVKPDGDWAVVDGPRPVAESRPPTWELTLVPMQVGELELPPLSSTVRSSDGTTREVSLSGASKVVVGSVLAGGDEEQQPAPMRDPVGVTGFPWEWFLPGAAVSLPLALLAAWWWSRRHGILGGDEARTAKLPPLEELLAALEQQQQRLGYESAEVVCDLMATALRRFLERRTGEPACEMTSFELRVLARRAAWPGPVQQGIQRVMAVADGVRFGRRQGTDTELRSAIDEARGVGRALDAHLLAAAHQDEAPAAGATA